MPINTDQFYSLCFSITAVTACIFFIAVIKEANKIPVGPLGPEFNLFSFGYLIDITIRCIRNEPYWTNFPKDVLAIKDGVLYFISFINLALLVQNILVAHQIESKSISGDQLTVKIFTSRALGLLSFIIYITFNTLFQ